MTKRRMSLLLLLALALFRAISQQVHARPITPTTVDSPSLVAPCSVTVNGIVFTNLQQAHDQSPPGSVLEMAPDALCTQYSAQYGQILRISKDLTVRGDPTAPATFDTDRFARSIVVEKPSNGARPKVTFENLSVQNSRAYGSQIELTSGAGLYVVNSDITINNTTFTNNHALGKGGAIYLSGSTATISNSIFDQNDSDYGGSGLHLDNASSANISNSYMANGFGQGSAVELLNGSEVSITNVDMWNNPTGVGVSQSSADITHSTIRGNVLSYGIFAIDHSTVAMTNTIVMSGYIGLVSRDFSSIRADHPLLYANNQNVEDHENTINLVNPVYNNPLLAADGSITSFSSSAWNAGIQTSVSTDINGATRDENPDIGAYELQVQLAFIPLIVR